MPTPPRAYSLESSDEERDQAAASDSDEELPSLHDRFKKMLNRKPTATVADPDDAPSTSSAGAAVAPVAPAAPKLVPPKAAPLNSMFINSKQREHQLPKPNHQHSSKTTYRQPREVIEIEDSPPAPASKQRSSSTSTSNKRFLSPTPRQPLTEITSSSSGESIVQLASNPPKSNGTYPQAQASTSTGSSHNNFNKWSKPPSYEPFRDSYRPAMSTPKKASNDMYSSTHLNAKARIMAAFNQANPAATGLATPLGKPRDPTLYASHSNYKPVQSKLFRHSIYPSRLTYSVRAVDSSVDPDLSGDLNPSVLRQINQAVESNRPKFEEALRDSSEGALQSLCAEIYTDMTAVEKGEEKVDGLVSCEYDGLYRDIRA